MDGADLRLSTANVRSPDWARRPPPADPARRRAVTEWADAHRSAAPDAAHAAYAAVLGDLDTADPSDAERIRWMGLRTPPAPQLEPSWSRLRDDCRDADLRAVCRIAIARGADAAGRGPQSDHELRAALDESRGSGSRGEFLVCWWWAAMHLARGRFAETLALARRAERIASARGLADERAQVLYLLCATIAAVGTPEDVASVRDAFAAALAALPGETAAARLRYLDGVDAERALESREWDTAAAAADRLVSRTPGWDRMALRHAESIRAAALAGAGRLDDAAAALHRGLAHDWPARDEVWLALETCAADIDEARGAAGAAAARRASILSDLAGRSLDHLGYEPIADAALRLGRALRDTSPGSWHVSLQVAGRALLERLREMDRSLAALPEIVALEDSDLRMLNAWRARSAAAHAGVLSAVRDEMLAAVRAGDAETLASLRTMPDHAAVCAWCRSVRAAGGRWIPLGGYLPEFGMVTVSHGICDRCAAEVRRLRR